MLAPCDEVDVQRQSDSASSFYRGSRRSTRRTTWPSSSRLKSWSQARRLQTIVDLVGSPTVERLTRAVVVVPVHKQQQLSPKAVAAVRDQDPPSALVLDSPHEPLDDREASVFVDRPEALTNPSATAPTPEHPVTELLALVGDEVPWTHTRALKVPSETERMKRA